MRYLITFSYDGTNFYGYQKQDGYRSIEGELERALKFINNNSETPIFSSGRTDKGVHALCQKAHFDLNVNITEHKLKCALNSNLPSDIHVIDVRVVDNNFHARYMVKEKTYKYYLNMGEYNPLKRNLVFQYCHLLDVFVMQEAIKYFIGEHDFESFTPTKDKRKNYVRTIYDAKVENIDNLVIFTFRGNGFIKYQIRNMVGYLIKIGEHKKDKDSIPQILMEKNRKYASITAHPEGLYLYDVKYNNPF